MYCFTESDLTHKLSFDKLSVSFIESSECPGAVRESLGDASSNGYNGDKTRMLETNEHMSFEELTKIWIPKMETSLNQVKLFYILARLKL